MIENHIKIDDILIKEPRLLIDWKGSEGVIENHIKDSFNRICTELTKLNIDTRLVMIPLKLYNGEIYNNQIGNWVKAQTRNRVKRLVIKTDAPAPHDFKIYLDGSDNGVTNNQQLVTLVINTNYTTATFATEYKFYRFRVESESALNLMTNIYLCETSFDDLIVYKTLENFFVGKYRVESDGFLSKAQFYKNKFDTELETLTFAYDLNNENDTKIKSTIIRVGL